MREKFKPNLNLKIEDKEVDKDRQCQIWLSEYTSDKDWLFMPCGILIHTLCKSCFEEYISFKINHWVLNEIQCPFCCISDNGNAKGWRKKSILNDSFIENNYGMKYMKN